MKRENRDYIIKRSGFFLFFFWVLFSSLSVAHGELQTKQLRVLRESGTMTFSINELIKDRDCYLKYFTNIDLVKNSEPNILLLRQQYTIKPRVRIEVDQGLIYTDGIAMDSLFKSPQNIMKCKVSEIGPSSSFLKIKIYDNYSNQLLAEDAFPLSPIIVHEYYPELHYTDVDGNEQVYTNESKRFVPISPNHVGRIIVKDEYGERMRVTRVGYDYPNRMGGTLIEMSIGDTISYRGMTILTGRLRESPECWIYPYIWNPTSKKEVRGKTLIIKNR